MVRILRSILLCVVMVRCVLAVCAEPALKAQNATPPAERFFEGFLGETEDQRRALAAVKISKKEEQQHGKAQLQQFLKSLRRQGVSVVQRGRDVAYLNALMAEIRPLMRNMDRYPVVRVHVANTDATDARSFPGGTIVFSKGLIDFAQSEAAVVGVLAHELSHVDHGHQLDGLRRHKLAHNTISSGNASVADLLSSGQVFIRQFAMPFRPQEESQADLDAAQWALQAGYDPMEMARMFRRLHQRDEQRELAIPGFLRSHPYHAQRFKAIKDVSVKWAADRPDAERYVGRKNLQQRIPRKEHKFVE